MLNQQKPLPKDDKSDGRTLSVVHEWHTIQGECLFTGHPAYFVRLAGCNLQCPLCDTDYTTNTRDVKYEHIVSRVGIWDRKLVVITGGEPYRQQLSPLCTALLNDGRTVQIETNGTLYRPLPREVIVVCSPKTPKLAPEMKDVVRAWKYVVREGDYDGADGLPSSALGMSKPPSRPTNKAPVYVQPCDDYDEEQNKRNMEVAVESCMKFGYRLCLQIHKLVGLP